MANASPPPHAPEGHAPVALGKLGVLLLHVGTPSGTSYRAVRRYLSEFLSDRRVIETHPLAWQPILQGIVLSTRPQKSGAAYKKIWNEDRDESPMRTIARAQAEALQARFANEPVVVDWAFRYGEPTIRERLEGLVAQGCRRVLLVGTYPQYCAASTATAYDKAFDALQEMRWQPAVRTAPPYHDDPGYVEALAASLRPVIESETPPEVILASYHGLPKAYLEKGDPYHCHCVKTTRLLREATGLDEQRLRMSFQSRFGRAEWLKPFTDHTLKAMRQEGIRHVAVIHPGFAVDCLETLEEVGIGLRDTFLADGGERFDLVPCLNDSPGGLDVLEGLARRELAGWLAV